jgi:hypothetical protein
MTSVSLQGQDIDLDDKLVAYYDFENVDDKIVPNIRKRVNVIILKM